jgi:3-deoxy-manno-octulosonate cytidylyltransferase (CMP-KDO synthetase)
VYEAYRLYCADTHRDKDTVVLNIQGDEPFIQPSQIQALISCFPTEIATLVHPFTEHNTWDDLHNPNYVKVAIAHLPEAQADVIGRALYFSRSLIPYLRGVEPAEYLAQGQHYRHIGMYAYRADILAQITSLPPTPLEKMECLEQLRWLEHGLEIRVAKTDHASIGIDTPEDLALALTLLD